MVCRFAWRSVLLAIALTGGSLLAGLPFGRVAAAPSEALPALRGAPPALAGCPPAPLICTWERTFGGAFEDKLYALAPLGDGGAVAVGSTRTHGVARFDGWVVRLDREGRALWQRQDGGPDTEQFYGVAAAGDGGVFVAGHTRSAGAGESDLWVERLDAAGQRLWTRTLGGPANDRARAVTTTPDGGLVAVGFSGSASAGGRDLWIVKLDGSGRLVWERRLGETLDEMAYAVTRTDAGGVLVGGYVRRADARGFDFLVVALDAAGAVLWQVSLDRTPFDLVTALVATDDGGAVLAGTSRRSGLDVRLIRLAADGAVRWERVIGGAGAETAWSLDRTADGFVLAGSTSSPAAGTEAGATGAGVTRASGSQDAWLVAFGPDGTPRFERRFGGALWDRATTVRALGDGSLWLGGYTTSQGAGYEDGWVVRLDRHGRR